MSSSSLNSSHAYRKIVNASRALQKATKVTTRRQAASDLVKLLTDTSLRNKVKKELALIKTSSISSSSSNNNASKNIEVEKAVTKELTKLYREVFRDAIEASLATLKSKVKFKLEDVTLILKVIRAIDAESGNAISLFKQARSSNQNHWSYVTEPFTFESFDRYRGSNSTNTFLSGNEIKGALKHCLAWLEIEEICNVAEGDLCNLLLQLCSRADYVVTFGTNNNIISNIMQELHSRIVPFNDNEGNYDRRKATSTSSSQKQRIMAVNAAKIFYNLIHNLISSLGIEISIFVLPCLKLIVEWIRHEKSESSLLQFMYGAAVEILAAYPEVCVSIFNSDDDKNLGKDIFCYAVRTWNTVMNTERDVLVGYFSAHLFVSETAGNMQGLFPGDLGNLGLASLNESKICQLVKMFLSDESLEKYSNYSAQTIDNGKKHRDRFRERRRNVGGNKRRRTTIDPVSIFNPLNKKERRYLEFCARVLRCAQRYCLMDAERSVSGNIIQTLVDECVCVDLSDDESKPNNGLSSARCDATIEELSKCPWISFVMKGLCSQINIALLPRVESPYHTHRFPMREAIHECLQNHDDEQAISQERVKIYLQIVAACSEVFPRGECWSSSNKWYVSNFSPLHGDPNYSIEDEKQQSYCNACSPSDLASLVHSICDILNQYGTTGGDLTIQSWALVCLLRLTESSKIAARYWDNSKYIDESDLLPNAWRRVWDTLFREELRFLSHTAHAVSGSHGELVLMLLTEIIRWSLTKASNELESKRDHHVSFLQKRQEKVWNLPLFKAAKRTQCSATFEFVSILLNDVDIEEGDEDAFNENELNEIVKYIPTTLHRYTGGKRRYRITLFCLSYIILSIKRNTWEPFRRILPSVTECISVLMGKSGFSCFPTTFSIENNRRFRVTESRHCLNENEKIHDKDSKFAAAWKDSIEPFWFQFAAEKNCFLWDTLNERDIMLSPSWSMEDRFWLSKVFSKQENSDNAISTDAADLYNIVISIVLTVLGFGPQMSPSHGNKMSLPSRLLAAKFIIVVSLYNEYSLNNYNVQWRSVEQMFESVLESVVDHMGENSEDNDIILSEIIGIFQLLRRSYLSGKHHRQVQGLFSGSKLSGFYNICKQQLEKTEQSDFEQSKHGNYDKSSVSSGDSGMESENDIEESQQAPFEGLYSDMSLSEPNSEDDFNDSNDESQYAKGGMKRKNPNDLREGKSSKKLRDNSSASRTNSDGNNTPELHMGPSAAKLSWLCAYTLLVLNPSFEVVNIIDKSSILPTDSTEPHNYVLCFGLFYHLIPLSLRDPEDKGGYTIFSMCRDLISEGRRAASQSSPYGLLGFQTCKMLTKARIMEEDRLSSQEIDDIIDSLLPTDNSSIFFRFMKTRPAIKYLQVNAGISCFRDGEEEFRKRFQSSFIKFFILECLPSKVSTLRRLGALAASVALSYSDLDQQKELVHYFTSLLPPFNINPSKKSGNSFHDWVEKKVTRSGNKSFADSERKFWWTSSSILRSDMCYITGLIIGETKDEEIFVDFLSNTFRTKSKADGITFLELKLHESIAFLRKYNCLEDQFQEYEFNFIRDWIADGKTLHSIPTTLCPSLIRSIMRIGYKDDLNHSSLQKLVADEFVIQNASIIIPCILVDQPHLEYDDEMIRKRDKLLEEVLEICEDVNLSNLLRSHIHDIYAVVISMMHCNTSENYPFKKRGVEILSYLQGFPKLGHRHITRTTNQIVTQMIELYGRGISFNGVTNCKTSIKDAINFFATKIMNMRVNTKQGLFENAGTSTADCLLYTCCLLDGASCTNGRRYAWKMVDFIVEVIQQNVCANDIENPQLGFAASTLINLLIGSSQCDLQCKVLLRLKGLMKAVTKERFIFNKAPNDFSWVLNKLILAMIQIHEDYQHRIMNFCLEKRSSESSRKSKGLTFKDMGGSSILDYDPIHLIDEMTSTTLAISEYGDSIPLNLIHVIETTYEILELVLVEKKNILYKCYTALDPFPKSKMTEEDEKTLMQFNKRFSLLQLLSTVDCAPGCAPIDRVHNDAKRFECVAKRVLERNTKKSPDPSKSRDSHSLEARILLAGIDKIQNSLSMGGDETHIPFELDKMVISSLCTIVQYLCCFCADKYTLDIQVAAASCLGTLLPILHYGNVDMLQIYNMQTEKRTFFTSDLFDHFFEGILKSLVDYVQAENSETAMIAKDTLKAILITNDGSSFWKDLKPDSYIKRFTSPFITKEKAKLDVDKIPKVFFEQLKQFIGLNEDDVVKDNSWCWSANLWKCNLNSGVGFDDWIRNVVSSILICCYGKDNERNEEKSLIHGTSDFFRPCLKLCTKEYRFAEALFPAIIFDILATDNKDSSTFSTPKNYLVGAATSLSNQIITQCFGVVLNPSENEDDKRNMSQNSYLSRSSQSTSNLDALRTVVTLLNILRCFTENSFYRQKFNHNTLHITGRTYDAKKGIVKFEDSKQEYNNLKLSVPFNGRPYGVVLDIQNMEIVKSYLQLKDYATAMYYAENFADNRLGGSACSFEMFPFRKIKQTSLSGFGKEVDSIDSKEVHLIAIEYHNVLKQCYAALHEEDNLKGLEEQTARMRFEKPECFKDDDTQCRDLNEKSLMLMDVLSQIDSGRGICNPSNQEAVLSMLSDLSLRETVKHYVAGLCVNQDLNTFSIAQCSYVKDKWAEETWRMLQWDETLLPKTASANIEESVTQPLTHDKDLVRKALRSSGHQNVRVGFNETLNDLFHLILREDMSLFPTKLYQSRVILLEDFNRDVGSKPTNGLFSHSLKFMTINEIEDLGAVISGSISMSEFLKKWCSTSSSIYQNMNFKYSFNDIESAMSCREIGLKLLFRKFGEHCDDKIGSTYFQHLKQTCVLAREHARPNLATGALERMRRFFDLTCHTEEINLSAKIKLLYINLEEARIIHSTGDTTAAVRTCKLIISSIDQMSTEKSEEISFLQGETLLQCGTWLIHHKIDAAAVVLNNYVRRAAEQAQEIHKKHNNLRSTELLSSTHFVLAEFVANLYDSVEKRINSQEWKSLGAAAEGRKKELEEVTKLIKRSNKSPNKARKSHEFNLRIEQSKLKREVEMDTRERTAVEESVSNYLRLAIRAYGVALSNCTGLSIHSKHVFRLVSLWFRNSNGDGKGGDINALIASEVTCRIPSYHFVPLIYQIFSRIDSSIDMDKENYTNSEANHEEFQIVLVKLIAKICTDHPYHSLVQLIALSNGHNVAGRQASAYVNNVGDSKVEAASKLLNSMEKTDPDLLAHLIKSYKTVINAYISLAVAPTKQFAEKRITKNITIKDLVRGNRSGNQGQPLDSCLRRSQYKPCVLTKTPSIRPGADYGNGLTCPVGSEFIDSFHSTCSITETGIHRPKIVICYGSNGGQFKQLVKGEDDIRQDAIMQQVFQTVNVLFQNRSASKRQSASMKSNIKLHTYSCIPLSPSNGVLEWVDNTTSFGDFLYRSSDGKKVGAHERYYPGEWDISLCRSHYMCSPRDEIRSSYDEICKNFSPCFRFFFLERFSHSPQRWHDARMAYVRSSAVNSIVGHILGIGDRHSHNILIHERSGEVVHIDFGIVFEQGKLLSTPETVPFRLTRDVVDGFGPNGTDGVFTAAAQATAEVLRQNSNTLVTVLSAVVSDPLYSWSVSSVKARQRGDESIFSKESEISGNSANMPALAMIAENENDAATLTIAKINEKLQGYEEGTYGEQQTVEGQVRLLINAARDPDNLCMLYHGWMPWL